MSRENEREHGELEALLRSHLARELDGQLGRSRRAFDAHVAGASTRGGIVTPAQWPRRRVWALAAVGTALAASAAALSMAPVLRPPRETAFVQPASHGRGAATNARAQVTGSLTIATTSPVDTAVDAPAGNEDLQRIDGQSVDWQQVELVVSSVTEDGGVVVVENQTPARLVRRVEMERTQWVDERRGLRIETIVPREDVGLIAMDTY